MSSSSSRTVSGSSPAVRSALEVNVRLHPAFIFAGVVLLLLWWGETGWLAAVGLTLSMAANVVGEAISLCSLDMVFEGISLLPTGAVPYPLLPREPRGELAAASGGLAANAALSALCLAGSSIAQRLAVPAWGGRLSTVAVMVGVGLLIQATPVLPFTGGRLLRSALAGRMSYRRATRTLVFATLAVALGLAVVGAVVHPLFLILAGYLTLAALTEMRSATTQADWSQILVTQEAVEPLEQLSRVQSARTALRTMMAFRRWSLPVMEREQLVGQVAFVPLLRRIASDGADCYLGEVMLPPPAPLPLGAPLNIALLRLEQERTPWLPVEHQGQPCGYLTRERLLALAANRERTSVGQVSDLDSERAAG